MLSAIHSLYLLCIKLFLLFILPYQLLCYYYITTLSIFLAYNPFLAEDMVVLLEVQQASTNFLYLCNEEITDYPLFGAEHLTGAYRKVDHLGAIILFLE